jgi:PTH1 family peptidyl-tRNA hydrolase
LRFGIGHPGDRDRVTGHVLSNFDANEAKILPELLTPCLDLLEVFVTKGGEAYKQALHQQLSVASCQEKALQTALKTNNQQPTTKN